MTTQYFYSLYLNNNNNEQRIAHEHLTVKTKLKIFFWLTRITQMQECHIYKKFKTVSIYKIQHKNKNPSDT